MQKKALVETQGDIKAAEELLRIKSGNKATKLAGRTAAEGTVAVYISDDKKKLGALLEVNCETDFVAKDANFAAFAALAVKAVAESNVTDIDALANVSVEGTTVEEARKAIVAKLGENITLRRSVRYETNGALSAYLHGSKIGVLIAVQGGDEQLGKDIAMHIAASKPVCVSKDQVPAELLETERKIFSAQAAESGKPAEIVAKMVEGRITKYLAEVTLLGQPFVKNPDQTVEKTAGREGRQSRRIHHVCGRRRH